MKTLVNVMLTALLILTLLWVVTQGNTTDAGKLIRLGSYLTSAILWVKYTTWGQRILNSKIFDL